MTLYYTLVFLLLVAEMSIFMLLIIPFPFSVRRKIFTFISDNPVVAKLQYGLKITFIFILILFIDSVNRVYRVQIELASATEGSHHNGAAIMGHERLEVQARKFYSQRNMYLCGFTLFLSLILNRTYVMIQEVLRLEEKLKQQEGGAAGKVTAGNESSEVARLKKELAKKDEDLQTLKKQAAGLNKEYDALSEKYSATQEDYSSKKSR